MRIGLIVAAGGSGTRFLESLPAREKQPSKLFLSLAELPILICTLRAFLGIPKIKEVWVSLPKKEIASTRALIKKFQLKGIQLVAGGRTRAESVWKALRKINRRTDWVMVHDGARPFVKPEQIFSVIRAARHRPQADGAILSAKVIPTIKEVAADGRILRTVDRSVLHEAQTPQLVRKTKLLQAYRENPNAFAGTDEASLVESVGGVVLAVGHTEWNPKITTYKDYELACAMMRKTAEVRTGFGRDFHRLVSGRKFYLGGIVVPFDKGSLGHSDGDVLLHAITDAILGALGAGDIGDWFSDQDARFKNIRSEKLLRQVLEEVKKQNWTISHLDTVVVLEKPKLSNCKLAIRKKIASILGITLENVSVKAKTMEGLGPEGEGLAVSAEALVTLKRMMP